MGILAISITMIAAVIGTLLIAIEKMDSIQDRLKPIPVRKNRTVR